MGQPIRLPPSSDSVCARHPTALPPAPPTPSRGGPPRRRAPGRAPGFGTFCCLLCAPLGPTQRIQQSQPWPLPVQECRPSPPFPRHGAGAGTSDAWRDRPGRPAEAFPRCPGSAGQTQWARPGARVELSSVALPASAARAERRWGAVAGVPRQVLLHCPAPGAAGRGGWNTTVAPRGPAMRWPALDMTLPGGNIYLLCLQRSQGPHHSGCIPRTHTL